MTGLMAGKRGLVMGIANDKSIAWGIAKALRAQGAEMALTYLGDPILKRLKPLADELGSTLLIDCDASNEDQLDTAFKIIAEKWGKLDFLVHAVAFSDKNELKGRFVDTTLGNFLTTMHVSCYSFTSCLKRAEPLMTDGGTALTLSYYGAEKVMPSYNVMGVAKAALETSVRYLAADLGAKNIRVNALSAGPMRTLAGSAISNARYTFRTVIETSPLQRAMTLEDIGGASLYLLSNLSSGVTGEVHYVDGGFNVMGLPPAPKGENADD